MIRATTITRTALALALALVAGCDASPELKSAGEASPSAWTLVDAARFGDDGESESLTVTLPDHAPGGAVALRVTTDPGVCFQLSSLIDGEGRAWIAGRSAGEYCRECEVRTSIAAEAGVFVLPVEPDLSLRFARVACETLTPLAAPDDRPPLRVEVQPIAAAPAEAAIELRFLIAPTSILDGDEARQEALVEALQEELASAGIIPRLVEARALDDLPDELAFHAGDPSALAAALADAPPRAETTVDVVFGGCLRYDDPIFGPPRAVDGFTPRIPGGAGPADAVFMPGLDCFAPGAGPTDLAIDAQAHVLAHELGHYLGLYHAVEADGATDQLADTGPDNIMHHNPGRAASIGFSPAQGRVMRAHPAARPL
ncbi:MAG: hypothetical protein H6711_34285 [Myxococcales bacterium]|nr:hypothetical protein [Myxococcales bacterium]